MWPFGTKKEEAPIAVKSDVANAVIKEKLRIDTKELKELAEKYRYLLNKFEKLKNSVVNHSVMFPVKDPGRNLAGLIGIINETQSECLNAANMNLNKSIHVDNENAIDNFKETFARIGQMLNELRKDLISGKVNSAQNLSDRYSKIVTLFEAGVVFLKKLMESRKSLIQTES